MRVEYEGVEHDFPDDFSQADIAAALASVKHAPAVKKKPATSDLRGLVSTVAQGGSFGLADEGAGLIEGYERGVGAFIDPTKAGASVMDQPESGWSIGQRFDAAKNAFGQGYDDTREIEKAHTERFRKDHPVTAFVAETAPAIVTGTVQVRALQTAGVGAKAGVKATAKALAKGQTRDQAVKAGVRTGQRSVAYKGSAIGGATYGAGTGEGVQDRALRAGGGGAAGFAGAGVGEAVAKVAGGTIGLVRSIANRAGATPDERALRIIAKGLREKGVTDADLQKVANKLPSQGGAVEEMVFELMGQPGFSQARAVANVPGPGKQIATDALTARSEGVAGRVIREASRATGRETTDVGEFLDDVQARRTAAAEPAYDAAYAEAIPDDVFKRDLAPLMSGGPVQARALGMGLRIAQADTLRAQAKLIAAQKSGNQAAIDKAARDLDDLRATSQTLSALRSGQEVSGANVRAIDYFQRGMRSLSETAGKGTTLGSAYGQNRNEFLKLVDAQAPAFKAAREAYGHSKAVEEMVEAGRKAFTTDDFEIAQTLRGVSAEERDAYMVGLMRAIGEHVNRGDTAFVARLTRNANLRNQIAESLGDQRAAQRFFSRAAREAAMAANKNGILSGSRTTPLGEDIKALTEGDTELGWLADLVASGGQLRGVATKQLGKVAQRIQQPGIYDPRVNQAMAERLYTTATPGKVRALIADMSADPTLRHDILVAAFEQAAGDAGRMVGRGVATYPATRQAPEQRQLPPPR